MVGASTVLLAQAFPESEFIGYDYHSPSIDIARKRAAEAALNNARFEVADATGYKEKDFDLIAFFDCLHDMDDPVGAARHARKPSSPTAIACSLSPSQATALKTTSTPVGRVYYGASSLICVPVSLARKGPALGAQAGEKRLREVIVDGAGFSRLRRATETPFNLVLEARP